MYYLYLTLALILLISGTALLLTGSLTAGIVLLTAGCAVILFMYLYYKNKPRKRKKGDCDMDCMPAASFSLLDCDCKD